MRILFLLLTLLSFVYADGSLHIKKGWQLIGIPTSLNIEESFNNVNVEILWGYDAVSQTWSGYSPIESKSDEISQNYATPQTLEPFQALWIFSKDDWNLFYSQEESPLLPKSRTIVLQEGWNLVAIPQKIVLSDKFFKDEIVWKYSEDQEWSINNENPDFPSIELIKQSEGLWVKSNSYKEINIDEQSSKLNSFESRDSMLNYIRKMISMNQYYDGYYNMMIADDVSTAMPEVADTVSSSELATDATTTNLQESGVDEGDILKHDGTHIFSVDNSAGKIIVSSFENISKQIYTPITSMDFTNKYIYSMYLQNSRLVVLSTISQQDNKYEVYNGDNLIVDIYDVSDIASIKIISTYKIDANYQDSRLIDGNLYLVSQFSPIIENEKLLPSIEIDGIDKIELIQFDKFYAPLKLNQSASITTISSFSIDSGEYKTSSSFLGNTHTYYASLTSLYLVSNEYPIYYDYTNYKEQQMIYKFSFDENLSYEAKGSVTGSMLNQFSMSEKDDYLRVATTSGWSWWNGGETINSVYTLKNENDALVVDGELTGLGHEGEIIKAVRFMGNRGFVVTFRETDPLYTLDMSDNSQPKVVGELSIPGFSRYLHIVDANRVLSVGRDADESGSTLGLQLQLFDISDFSNPLLADKIKIGDRYTYSEAEYNHKAFSYRGSDLKFGIAYRSYSYNDNTNDEHFGIYQVDDLSIKSVSILTSSNSSWGNVGRGLIFDFNSTSYGALLKGSNVICEDIGE